MHELLPADLRRRARVKDATRRGLQWLVLPVWMAAGLADWWCHRRSDIEHTTGTTESAIHAAMMVEGGVPALLGLFCEVDAAALAVTYVALALHDSERNPGCRLRGWPPRGNAVRAVRARRPGARADDGDLLADRLALGPGASCRRAPRATRLGAQAERLIAGHGDDPTAPLGEVRSVPVRCRRKYLAAAAVRSRALRDGLALLGGPAVRASRPSSRGG